MVVCKLFVLAIVGSILVGRSDACSCLMPPVEKRFCNSDLVIKATLSNRRIDGNRVTFDVNVLENYKPSSEFDSTMKVLKTASEGNSCGFGEEGRTYVIFGRIMFDDTNGGSYITSHVCDGNADVTDGVTRPWVADILDVVKSKPACDE